MLDEVPEDKGEGEGEEDPAGEEHRERPAAGHPGDSADIVDKRTPRRPYPLRGVPPSVDDRLMEIKETWRRIRRPLQWPMEDFRRARLRTKAFDGYRFSKTHGRGTVGFVVGFAMRLGRLPFITDPPEAVAYVFVEPEGSRLHRELVTKANSPVRRLIRESQDLDVPYASSVAGAIVAVRHRSMRAVPPELFPLVASDFFLLSYRPFWSSGFLERVRRPRRRSR